MIKIFDVVIVGAGGDGLRAAVEIPKEYSCTVISKVYPPRSHTGTAQGGVCPALRITATVVRHATIYFSFSKNLRIQNWFTR